MDAEIIRKVEAVVYIMAEKFLETAEMEQLRKEITMTKLGQMIYDDGVQSGAKAKLKEQVEKKVKKGCSVAEIADMLEEERAVIEEIIAEL